MKPDRFKLIALAATAFFFIFSIPLFFNSDHRYTWPDEMANYHAVRQFMAGGSFGIAEPLLEVSKNLVHPRSTNVFNGMIVPGSFIGFPLFYGALTTVTRNGFIFLTPLLAAIAGIALFRLIEKLFDERVAAVSALLYFVTPAVWYYSGFALLPNIPFTSLLLIGAWLMMSGVGRWGWLRWFVGCALVSVALSIRPTEAVWILPLAAYAVFRMRGQLTWKHAVLAAAALLGVLAPNLWYARATFGSWLGAGYLNLQTGSLPTEASAGSSIGALLLPFGFHPLRAIRNIWTYVFLTHWWLLIPAAWGFSRCIRAQRDYCIAASAFAAYLAIYYGSWQFADTVTLKLGALGVSYVRYLLPAIIAILPFVARAILDLSVRGGRYRVTVLVLVLVICAGMGTNMVWFAHGDSMLPIIRTYGEYARTARAIFDATDPDGVIVTERGDKIFWPDRSVISAWGREDAYKLQALAIAGTPLYFFGLERETDIAYLNDRALAPYELRIDASSALARTPNGNLYSIRYEPSR